MGVLEFSMAVVAVTQLCFGFDFTYNIKPEPMPMLMDWFGSDNNKNNNNNNGNNKIVGGQEASIEDYPHQIGFKVNNIMCGGFIISHSYIVTAAHCVQNVTDPEKILLRGGHTFWNNGTIIPISEVIYHPEFSKRREFDLDVAVMKTEDPITFSNVMQPIPLPRRRRHPMIEGTKVNVSGWGETKDSETDSMKGWLMDVEVPVVNHATCFVAYPEYLTENEWCSGDLLSGGKAPCQGDSGSAAVQDGMAVGIVSFSKTCAKRGVPTVYADTSAPSIRRFIRKHTGV